MVERMRVTGGRSWGFFELGVCRAVYSRFHCQTVETELRCGQLVFSGTVPPQAAATDAGLPCQARGTVLDGALSAVPVKGPPLHSVLPRPGTPAAVDGARSFSTGRGGLTRGSRSSSVRPPNYVCRPRPRGQAVTEHPGRQPGSAKSLDLTDLVTL